MVGAPVAEVLQARSVWARLHLIEVPCESFYRALVDQDLQEVLASWPRASAVRVLRVLVANVVDNARAGCPSYPLRVRVCAGVLVDVGVLLLQHLVP